MPIRRGVDISPDPPTGDTSREPSLAISPLRMPKYSHTTIDVNAHASGVWHACAVTIISILVAPARLPATEHFPLFLEPYWLVYLISSYFCPISPGTCSQHRYATPEHSSDFHLFLSSFRDEHAYIKRVPTHSSSHSPGSLFSSSSSPI